MSIAIIFELERDIGNYELILNIIKDLYMESRQNEFQEPTLRHLFGTVSYIHNRIETKQCELKMLKDVHTALRSP